MSTDALDRATEDYRRAIELDPQYALAYLNLGTEVYNYAVARGIHVTGRRRSARDPRNWCATRWLSIRICPRRTDCWR